MSSHTGRTVETLFKKAIDFTSKEVTSNQIPIFICGMPRSGTTLCEQILSSHSKITGAGELNYLANVSGISRVISPTYDQLKEFEDTLNNKKKLVEARKKYLKQLSLHDKKNYGINCKKNS